jgi:hypothetical protein
LNFTARSSTNSIQPDPKPDPVPSRRGGASVFITLLVACLTTLAGCRGGRSPGEAEPPDEHAGHVIPAHKPKDFPSAVRRLRELNTQIALKLAEGKASSLVSEKTLPIALDIANWLPEIAADSDMPVSPWNEVNDRSASLVSVYQKMIEGAAIDDHPVSSSALSTEANTIVKALETLLDSADPRWFDSAKPGVKR